MAGRYQSYVDMYGASDFGKIQAARVLLVGAGGIGCEILKNLVLSGFRQIEVIDLDTIDVSNLNRQFLFRSEHVGKPKSVVAAQAATAFNPDAQIVAHHGNIKDNKYGTTYFGKFDIVLNALDNVDARKHVNRLCLAAKVPLIDSGTTGFLGQVMPIFKGKTSCYECKPKPTQKVYPICTIRSTPDQPVHCIVWAKELFKLLCGTNSESMLFEEETEDSKSTYMKYVKFPTVASPAEWGQLIQHGVQLLVALFSIEVSNCIEAGVYAKAKKQPVPISESNLQQAGSAALATLAQLGASSHSAQPFQDTDIWGEAEAAKELLLCMMEAAATGQSLQFDKDDSLAMRFVASASNLRSRIFGIDLKTFHDAKGIAGNIIPAIATTNAIVAGIQVLQAVKVLLAGGGAAEDSEAFKCCSHVYVNRMPNRKGTFLQPSEPEGPEAECYVCSSSQVALSIDTANATLATLVEKVLKRKLGFNAPNINFGANVLYEEGDDADEETWVNLEKTIVDCLKGAGDGSVISIYDQTQDLEIEVNIKHISAEELAELGDGPAEDGFVLGGLGDVEKKRQQMEATAAAAAAAAAAASVAGTSESKKRGRDEEKGADEGEHASKKTVAEGTVFEILD